MKLLKSKTTDDVVELLAEDGDSYWVKSPSSGARWTTEASRWESHTPTPKVGEVWQYSHSSITGGFRILAVNAEEGWFLMTPNYPSDVFFGFNGDLDGRAEVPARVAHGSGRDYTQLYYRPLPEKRLVPKETK